MAGALSASWAFFRRLWSDVQPEPRPAVILRKELEEHLSKMAKKEVRVGPRNKSHYLYDLEFEYEMMRRTQSQLPALPWGQQGLAKTVQNALVRRKDGTYEVLILWILRRQNEKGLLRDDRSRLLLQSLEDAWSKLVRAVAWGPPTKEEDVPAPDPLEVGKVALATWDKCLAHAALVGGSTSFLTNVIAKLKEATTEFVQELHQQHIVELKKGLVFANQSIEDAKDYTGKVAEETMAEINALEDKTMKSITGVEKKLKKQKLMTNKKLRNFDVMQREHAFFKAIFAQHMPGFYEAYMAAGLMAGDAVGVVGGAASQPAVGLGSGTGQPAIGTGQPVVAQGFTLGAGQAATGQGWGFGAGQAAAGQGSGLMGVGTGQSAAAQGVWFGNGQPAVTQGWGFGAGQAAAGQGSGLGASQPAVTQGVRFGTSQPGVTQGFTMGAGQPAVTQGWGFGAGQAAAGQGSGLGASQPPVEQRLRFGVGVGTGQPAVPQGWSFGAGQPAQPWWEEPKGASS